MIVKTYNTDSPNNTINKNIVFLNDIDVKFKDEVNIYNPLIILKYIDLIDFNYVYIDKFKRYYYVDDVEVQPNKIYKISLKCDVLMSFKDDILDADAYIYQSNNVNKYYNSNYQSEVKKEVDIYKSDYIMSDEKSIILVTIGG